MPRPRSKKNGGTVRGASGKPRGSAPATQQTEAAPPEPGGGAKTNVAHVQSTVHQTACDLLAALHRVEQELRLSDIPTGQEGESRWANISAALVSLRTIWNRLGECRANLDMFRGLRPDGVAVCGIVCGSWHQGVIHVGDAVYKLLRIPVRGEADVTGEYLWAPEEADWTRDDLGLPSAGEQERGRSRAELWNRAVALYRSENTLLGPNRQHDAEFHTSGWATLRELDFRSLPAQLAAEWRFATRQQIPPPVEGGTDDEQKLDHNSLSDFQRQVLVTMLTNGITSRAKLMKQRVIRELVDSESTPDGRPFAQLSNARLLDAKKGTEGGYWLTEAGCTEARRIAEEDAG